MGSPAVRYEIEPPQASSKYTIEPPASQPEWQSRGYGSEKAWSRSKGPIRQAYNALPLLQKIKLETIPGAYEKWEDTTFNQGRYSGDNSYEKVLRPTVGEMTGGAGDIGEGEYARGAHRMITGAGRTALPLLPGAVGKAPLATAMALAGGWGGSKVGRTGAELLGATPDQADLASDVGGLAGGGLTAKYGPAVGSYAADVAPQVGRLALREATSRVPILNRVEGFTKPTWGDVGAAFRRDPQLSLYRNTPKLGDSPLAVTNPALPQGEIAPTQSFSPQPLARPELVPSPGRYTTSPYASEGIPTSEAVDPRTDVFANFGAPEVQGTAPAPRDMSAYYGKTPTRSNLKANQRQLASPTASTAPVPAPYPQRVMNLLNSPVEPTDADILEIQQAVRQRRLVDQMP